MKSEAWTLDDGCVPSVAILPGEYLEFAARSRQLRGEHRLVLAILEDAIHICNTANRHRRLFRETAAWIESTDRSWMFSFERICELLELDPEYVRRGVRASSRRAHLASVRDTRSLPEAGTQTEGTTRSLDGPLDGH
jgi:hypothetical protein